jgi:hypothetical protein
MGRPALALSIGQVFSRLTLVRREGSSLAMRWVCLCECGNATRVRGSDLASGRTRSCGCLHTEIRRTARKHGHARRAGVSPTFQSWSSMLTRCTNPNNAQFHDYGGRGIQVCDRWLKFENFLADMGERPDGLTLDRRDSNGNYAPGNCRWATWDEQGQNRRSTKLCTTSAALIRYMSRRGSRASDLAYAFDVNVVTIRNVIHRNIWR